MASTYEGIILGAGHNGLVLQAYLARAGLKTICLERRAVAGGGLATIEHPPGSGFFHNTHAFYHRGLTHSPWYRDLDLRRRGAVYLEPPLNVALVTRKETALEWWTDFERTVDSFARCSLRDAESLRRWIEAFRPIVRDILWPEAQAPLRPGPVRRALLKSTKEGRLLLAVSRLSPLEFVRREFEHPLIQAGLLFFNGLREVDLNCRGLGHHIPALLAGGRMAQMCGGGSKQLADALTAAVFEAGGEVRLEAVPRKIVVEDGRAIGVELAGGEFIGAGKFVASSLNPHQTFLELLDEHSLPRGWGRKVRGFQYNLVAPLFALNVNLREPPAYHAAARHPELNQAFMIILGLERPEQFDELLRHHQAGTIPPGRIMWGSCPTLFDSSQAPPGRHTGFMWEKLPYRLNGDPSSWDDAKPRQAQAMLEFWNQYAPNLAGSVLDRLAASPLDVERALPNMKYGDLLVGSFAHGQIGYYRPFAGAGHYRGPVKGLYLCGSCCHPGGNITGLPGYNCAQVLLADLGLRNASGWGAAPAEP